MNVRPTVVNNLPILSTAREAEAFTRQRNEDNRRERVDRDRVHATNIEQINAQTAEFERFARAGGFRNRQRTPGRVTNRGTSAATSVAPALDRAAIYARMNAGGQQ